MDYYNHVIETMKRPELDALVENRIQNTIRYAYKHSPFYRKWFDRHGINPSDIQTHEDLRDLPLISGGVIRENQPPITPGFEFKSILWKDVYTIHETSGTSGVPKSFF
ncbi:MAG: hypothetical protein NKF70_07130 [Methanobacterium sp. ERen5]|nr:MAG: hypothetical protein NKF70_07130 [Methanobacterium sp. ERen5]